MLTRFLNDWSDDFHDMFQVRTPWLHTPSHNMIKVNDDTYKLEVQVPGYNKNNIKVIQNSNTITISGECEETKDEYAHKGFHKHSFTKRFHIKEGTEVSNVELKDGILNMNIKYNSKESNTKELPIK